MWKTMTGTLRQLRELNGAGFKCLVNMGERVKAGQKLIEFDPKLVVDKRLCPDIIMIFMADPNLPELEYQLGMNAEAGITTVAVVK